MNADLLRHCAKIRHEGGMAVLMALIAVGLALMIGLALASTRDANTSASGGLVGATATRTASSGALDIATYIARRHGSAAVGNPTENSRAVFEAKKIGSYTLSAVMRDANTGASPTAETSGLELTASGSTGAVTQSTRRTVRVDWANVAERADFDLSEFALLTTTGSISIDAGSEVSVWRDAPLTRLAEPILIGNSKRDPSRVTIHPDARALGYAVLTNGKFPETEADADELLANREFPIPADIVVPNALGQGVPSTFERVNFQGLAREINASSATGLRNFTVVADTIVSGRARVPMPPPQQLMVDGPIAKGTWRVLSIDQGMTLNRCNWTFNERTMLIVRGDLRLVDSQIRIGPLGALAIVASGLVDLNRSTIGPDDGNPGNSFSADGTASYRAFGASRCIVYTQGRPVNIGRGSVVKGQIYGPSSPVTLQGSSAVYGRILGRAIDLKGGSNFFYDPELDAGTGWRNPKSGIWWRRNEVRTETAMVGWMRDMELSNFSKSTMIAVDEPETGMVPTVNVAAAGGFGVVSLNQSDGGAVAVAPSGLPTSGAAVQYPDLYLVVNGVLRDFREATEAGGHPDFDNPSLARGQRYGMVKPTLTPDGKPELADTTLPPINARFTDSLGMPIAPSLFDATLGDRRGAVGKSSTRVVTGAESFRSWFRDTPGVNLSEPYRIIMRRALDANRRTCYIYDSSQTRPFGNDGAGPQLDGFFPLQNRLFGNSPLKTVMSGKTVLPADRNYHFTLELSMEFVYRANAGQGFRIDASDDTFAFIDGKLVIDLGGVHAPTPQLVPLDRLGLSDGQKSTLKIFHASRVRTLPYFRFATNFPVTDPLPPQPPAGPTQYLEQLALQREMTLVAFLKKG